MYNPLTLLGVDGRERGNGLHELCAVLPRRLQTQTVHNTRRRLDVHGALPHVGPELRLTGNVLGRVTLGLGLGLVLMRN